MIEGNGGQFCFSFANNKITNNIVCRIRNRRSFGRERKKERKGREGKERERERERRRGERENIALGRVYKTAFNNIGNVT